MPRQPFNLGRHNADYAKYGWPHKVNCLCRGNSLEPNPVKVDLNATDAELPADKRFGDGKRIA